MIKVSNVSKTYATGVRAIRNVSYEVPKGQVLYILGESGSGKSTLLKMMSGFEDTDTGIIQIDGTTILGPSDQLVPGHDFIAYLSQDFRLQRYWTVRDNICKKISHHSDDYQEERLEELLEVFQLTEYADKYPNELSGGQQQRIAIAAAIADDPLVVMLDEPFSNLDLPMKSKVRKEMMDILQKMNITIVLVSHDPAEALAVADKIILLKDGEIEQYSTPQDLYHHPASYYSAKFLGPVNTLQLDAQEKLIRPENLMINSTGKHSGKVVSSLFMGMNYHNYIETPISENPILIYSKSKLEVHSIIRFGIEK